MPQPEVNLWKHLRGKQLLGFKFRRQFGVGPYIVDFYSPPAKLAIEIDGDTHFGPEAEQRDKRRQEFIESFEIEILRFTNSEVMKNIEGVILCIQNKLLSKTSPNPSLARRGE